MRPVHWVWTSFKTVKSSVLRNLVGTLQVLLQGQRLKVAPSLAEADLLVRELMNFRARVSTVEQQAESWREGDHDDSSLVDAIRPEPRDEPG